ncbi:DUF6531 domain-containing protein [Streptomyces aidingensis]|uniref:RHS repeat-associated core domain-containing protein n=1 Tax=Streptomyces aidingensis TaxID=910347 RepID=A0A1I1TKJ6_9ACTN|nr:DUF6531 domain-containing protein [Streptomyces aidingensis]SFD59172.1 RHS repeat-associated core domain-containing protein [Streptomyces aidingensis]
MGRASDWSPLDMDQDPTPGDPSRIEQLGNKFTTFADDVYDALQKVRTLGEDGTLAAFVGESADSYRDKFDKVPPNLEKLHTSYDLAGQALLTYAPKLEDAQRDADQALTDAEDARAELSTAQSWLERATSTLDDAEDAAEPPDEEEVSAEVRRALSDAQLDAGNAQTAVDDAREKLNAAIALAQQAKEAREEAAERCKRDLEEASDAGMQNKKWWQKAVDWVVDNWDTIVNVCKIIVAVVGIIAMIVGGPLALLVLAAALIVLADTLIKYANGEASLWDVAFAALDCIPGMKGLTTAAGLLKGVKSGLKGLKAGAKGLGRTLRRHGRPDVSKVCKTDPVDMATGEMLTSATDFALPSVMRLEMERHHLSGYRHGRWFGPSWASVLDQHLRLADDGVQYFAADGMILDFPVPGIGLEQSVVAVEGPRWDLAWDGEPHGLMTVHRTDDGRTLHFRAAPGQPDSVLPLVAMTDRNGNRVDVLYDERGEPREVVHSGGYRLGVSVDDGRITEFRLLSDPEQRVLVSYGYDAQGNLAKIYNSSGLPYTFTYDDEHRIVAWEDRNGHWYRYAYDEAGRCTGTEGAGGYLASSIVYDPDRYRTHFTDALGNTTTYQFNDAYQLVAETDPLGNTIRREWDRYDRLLSVTDPGGHRTRYGYDEHGRVSRITRPDGRDMTVRYNQQGLPVLITEADGTTWRQEYDDAGNRTAVIDPLGAATRFEYGAFGHLVAMVDELGGRTTLECNAAGLPTVVVDPTGSRTEYRHDPLGRVIEATDPLGAVTRMQWTLEGLPLLRVGPQGETQQWSWDAEGNCLSITDPAGGVVRFEPGPFGLLLSRTAPDGARLYLTHDAELQVTSVTGPHGLTWTYRYDAVGNVIQEEDFDGAEQSYAYDPVGRPLRRVTRAGSTVSFRYNSLGLMTEKDVDGSRTRFDYDPAGRMLRASGPDSAIAVERDPVGRTVRQTVDGRTAVFGYDAAGQLRERITPSGLTSAWDYDAAGLPTVLRSAGRALTWEYDRAGREVTRGIGPDLRLRHSWDASGRLSGQALVSAGTVLEQRHYAYRADRHVVGLHNAEGLTEFTLDPAGRVLRAMGGGHDESYAYDLAGGVTAARWQSGGGEPDAAGTRQYVGTRVMRAGRTRYEYDTAGRIVRRERKCLSGKSLTWRYNWDAEDRLIAVTTPQGSRWRYRYDPLGRRIAKEHLSDTGALLRKVDFSWHGTQLIEQVSVEPGNDKVTTITWDYLHQHPVAQTTRHTTADGSGGTGGETLRFHSVITDFVGTPTELVDESGHIDWRARTTVWGVPATDEYDHAMPLRFPGQYADPETGWNYNYYRHYDPETARYVSPDPLGMHPHPNHYGYVDNPFLAIDPLGLECKKITNAKKVLQQTIDRAGEGKRRLHSNYHGHLSEARELEILRNPDAAYLSTGTSQRIIVRGGDDIVVMESAGARKGQIITSYGPSGPRNESGAAALGGKPEDPGLPVTHDNIVNGTIPTPGGSSIPPAVPFFP